MFSIQVFYCAYFFSGKHLDEPNSYQKDILYLRDTDIDIFLASQGNLVSVLPQDCLWPPGVDAMAKLGRSCHPITGAPSLLALQHHTQNLGPRSHFGDSPNAGCIPALCCAVWIQNRSLGISKWLLKATWSAGSVLPGLSPGSGGDVFNVAWQSQPGGWGGDKGGDPGEKLLPCHQKPTQTLFL